MFARVFAGDGGDFRREQIHDRAVLVGCPHRAVAPQETGPGAFLATKTKRAIEQSRREPFEADGCFAQPAAQLVHHAINHAAAHQCFANGRAGRPLRTMREQITNGHRQVMIRVHQTGGWSDDAVPVRIGVVGERDAEFILETHEAGHRIRAGAIHADFSVMIHRHERERRVELWVHDRDIQFVSRINRFPIWQRRAAERVHAQLQTGGADGVQIHDIFQILNIGQNKIVLMGGCRLERRDERHALHAGIIPAQQFVCAILHPACHVGVGGAAVGRIIFEAAVFRRIVRRRDDNAVGQTGFASAIVNNNGAGNNRRWRHAIGALNDRLDLVGRQNFQRGALRRGGQRVRIFAHLKRAVDVLAAAVIANGLGDGENVGFVEGAGQRRAAMPARAEADQLIWVGHIRPPFVILAFEPR